MIYPFDLKPGDRIEVIKSVSRPDVIGQRGFVTVGYQWLNGIDRNKNRVRGFRYTIWLPDYTPLYEAYARREQLRKLPPETDAERNETVSWDSCPWKPKELVE